MNDFVESYFETLFWSEVQDNGDPFDYDYGPEHLAPESRREMLTECEGFVKEAMSLLTEAGISMEQAGHDFALTRNGHGVGFWDRGHGLIGEQLSDMCDPYGHCNLYVGDDGRVYSA